MNPSIKRSSEFVLNFFLINKFDFANIHDLPSMNKIILNSFIQDLDNPVSSYYYRFISIIELLTTQRVIIKNVKKTLKGKKSYQVVVSHYVTLRKKLLYNFFYFFVCFGLQSLEDKFLTINHRINFDGTFYFRIKDLTALPGLAEEFFKWPYFLDFFFSLKNYKNPFLAKTYFRYFGFPYVR